MSSVPLTAFRGQKVTEIYLFVGSCKDNWTCMESIVGKILFDRYRIVRELSRNQFSTIFDAEDLATPNQPQCQIEKLQPSYDSEVLGEKSWQKVSQTFVRQGNTLQKISHHPQIPQLLAFFECDRHFYLVREFIKGRTLAQKIEQSLIEEAEAIDWLQDILGILDFIHQAGIIHLNIQPSSLIEQYDGKRFLTNFSSVKNAVLFDHQSLETIANRDFVSPEQLEGKQNFNTDIYALGKTIIYALTGKVGNAIESNLSSDERLPITANIRPELAELLNKMVAENSAQRYESAAKVLEELDFGKQVVTLPPPMFADFRYPITDLNSKGKSQKRNSARELFKKPQKLIWLLLALPFIIAVVIIFVGINKNAYADFETYFNPNYQFQIKYPQNWLERDLNDPITGDVVVFSSPAESQSDLFIEKVYLTVEYLASENITLEEYTQNAIERIARTGGSNIEVLPNSQTSINNLPTTTITYARKSDKLPLKQMETFAIKEDSVYIAIYIAERTKFPKFLDTAKKMINSWSIE